MGKCEEVNESDVGKGENGDWRDESMQQQAGYRDRRELIISWVGVRHWNFWHTGAKFTLTLLCVRVCVSVPLEKRRSRYL